MLMLKEKRQQRNLTMKEVAVSANISESLLCLIEHGKRRPSVETAKRIAETLGFDWTEFFDDKTKEQEAV